MKNKYVITFVVVFILYVLGAKIIYDVKKEINKLKVSSRAGIKISELPSATTFDANDLFIVADAGISSKQLPGLLVVGAISDTAEEIRYQIDTAKINLRAEGLGGSGAFTKSGNHVSLLVNTDTVHMGTTSEYGKLNVYGSIGTIAGNIKADYDATANAGGVLVAAQLALTERGGSGQILSTGDDLYFMDNSTGVVSLSSIVNAGGYYTNTNNTVTMTSGDFNINFGALTETTHKVKVTGTFNATQPIYSDDKIYFQGSSGYTGAPPYIESDADTLYFSDNSGKFSLQELTTSYGDTINFSNGVYITTAGAGTLKLGYGSASLQLLANYAGYNGWGTNNLGSIQFAGYSSDIAAAFRNDTISDAADSAIFRSWKATKEYVSEHGGGVVDTAGGQDINKIAVWANKTVLDGPDDFTYQNGNMKITVGGTDRLSLYPTVSNSASSIAYLFSSNSNLTNATSKTFQFDNQNSNKFYQIGSGRIFNENGGYQAGLGTTNFSDITAAGFRTVINSVYLLNLNPGISAITEGIAYGFNTQNSLTGNSRLLSLKNADVEKFAVLNDSTIVRNYLLAKDTIYYRGKGLPAGSLWYTNTPTGAVDTAHTEPAYIGWEMSDLPTLEEYEKDVKMINGHMERRVWYIDYETKELKSQYGWDGLGMMNTQSAYMIYHEITVRWMFEQNKKLAELEQAKESDINLGLDVKFLIGLLVFVALMGLIVGLGGNMKTILTILLITLSFSVSGQIKEPFLHYSFDNTLLDSMLTGKNLTAYDNATFSSSNKAVGSHSGVLDGGNDYFKTPTIDLTDTFTISMWFRANSSITDPKAMFATADTYDYVSPFTIIALDNYIKIIVGYESVRPNITITTGVFHHLVASVFTKYGETNPTVRIWYDGNRCTMVGNDSTIIPFDPISRWNIGVDRYVNFDWNGYFDEIRIYNGFIPNESQADSLYEKSYIRGYTEPGYNPVAGVHTQPTYRGVLLKPSYRGQDKYWLAKNPLGAYEYNGNPITVADSIEILFAENFETFPITSALSYDTVMNHFQVWKSNWYAPYQSIVDLNDGDHEQVWHARIVENEWSSGKGFTIFIPVDTLYEELWVDVDMRVMPGFDTDEVGGCYSGKLPTGGVYGGLNFEHYGDSIWVDSEEFGAWWVHTVFGSNENMYNYAYTLSGAKDASGYIGPLPQSDWKHYSTKVKINPLGTDDGAKEVFIDGNYASHLEGLKMRAVAQGDDYGLIEGAKFSFFFGGPESDPCYASTQDQWIEIDNLKIISANSGTRKNTGSYESGDKVWYPTGVYDNVKPDSILFCEDFTTNTGTVQSHYVINRPPDSKRTYRKTITVTEGNHINIDFDYYRFDWDYGDNSWMKIYSGTGGTKSLLYTFNLSNLASTSSTYHISDNEVTIEYYMGTNNGPSKGWKLTYEGVAP